ncbi:hypothetical protein M8J77_009866 [Diaphorina citri]|nr:hypothetical protein M8J77_009866 [Diaphorina citri]
MDNYLPNSLKQRHVIQVQSEASHSHAAWNETPSKPEPSRINRGNARSVGVANDKIVIENLEGRGNLENMFAHNEFKSSDTQYECFLVNFKLFHYFGLWSEDDSSRLYSLYNAFVYMLLVVFFVLSLFHTIQSISHFELFTQLMVETIFVSTCFVNISTFFLLSKRIKLLLHIMKNDFLSVQKDIAQNCIRLEKFICIVSCILVLITYYALVKEKIFGRPTIREVNILKKVYNQTHPERRFPVRLYSGPLDYTISPYYEGVACYDVILLGVCFYIHYMAISTVPIFCVHIAGQLRTLSKLAESTGPREGDTRNLALIKHHIGIIRFFKEFETIFRPVFMIKIVLRLIFITLEIVQLSLLKSITDPRFTRTLTQMVIGFTDFLFFCASSEVVNIGEETLFRSVYNSRWYEASPRIRQRVSMMLEYLKRPLKYSFYSTFLIIDLSTFIGGMRLAYSVFTLLHSFIE